MHVTGLKCTLLKFPKFAYAKPTFSVNPIHMFRDMRAGGATAKKLTEPDLLILEVETDEGIVGIANSNYTVTAVRAFIETNLAPLIIGEDPFQTELLWEKMFRQCIKLGREGVSSIAMALIDIALWDIKGKALNQPVYNLLNGKTRDKIRAYASRLYGPDLGALREEASMYVDQGFTAMKLRFSYGPSHGLEGMKKNREMVKTVRETIGDGIELMVDCCRAYDATYAIKMLRMVEEFELMWAEEPVLPHDHIGYAQVRQAVTMPISGGEHEFSRHAFRSWAEMGCADIWQPDVNRAGGITECQKIVHLAAAYGIPVIPHAGQMHNYHLIIANINMPLAEYFPPQDEITDSNAHFWYVTDGEPQVQDGYITLSDKPGFGLELNQDAIRRYAL